MDLMHYSWPAIYPMGEKQNNYTKTENCKTKYNILKSDSNVLKLQKKTLE